MAHASRRSQHVTRLVRAVSVMARKGGLRSVRDGLTTFLFCSQRIDHFVLDLSSGYTAPSLDPRVEIRRATPEDLAQIRAMPEGNGSDFYRDVIDGAEPFVALWEGHYAHIAWIYDSTMPTRFIRLQPGEAELRYGYTCDGFRGRGLYGATNAVMVADLARRGYRKVYGHVVDHGTAFRLGLGLALRRIGFCQVRTMTHVRILGVQIRPRLSL